MRPLTCRRVFQTEQYKIKKEDLKSCTSMKYDKILIQTVKQSHTVKETTQQT